MLYDSLKYHAFFGLFHHVLLNEARRFGNWICFFLQAKESPNLSLYAFLKKNGRKKLIYSQK